MRGTDGKPEPWRRAGDASSLSNAPRETGHKPKRELARYRRKNGKKSSEKGDWQSQRIIVPGVRDAERPYRVGGELMHKGPTVGKVKPGITFYCAELRRCSETSTRINASAVECGV